MNIPLEIVIYSLLQYCYRPIVLLSFLINTIYAIYSFITSSDQAIGLSVVTSVNNEIMYDRILHNSGIKNV